MTLPSDNVSIFKKIWRGFGAAFSQMRDGELGIVSSSLAFSTAIALVPFLAVVLAILQSVGGGIEVLYPKVEAFLLRNLREAAGSDVTRFIRIFLKNVSNGKMGTTGGVILFLTSIRLLFDMEIAVNRVWNIKNSRAFYKRFIVQWALLLAIPLLLAVYIGFISLEQFKIIRQVLPLPVSNSLVLFFCLFAINKYVPARPVQALSALIGSAITAICLFVVHKFYAILILKFFAYNKVYGSFAALPMLLLWLLLMWYVVLGGVAITATLEKRHDA